MPSNFEQSKLLNFILLTTLSFCCTSMCCFETVNIMTTKVMKKWKISHRKGILHIALPHKYMHIRSYRKINYISPRAENFFNNEKNYIWEKLFEFFSIKKWDNEGVWALLASAGVMECTRISSESDDEVDLRCNF